jgi:ELWxxDGT repeat protein
MTVASLVARTRRIGTLAWLLATALAAQTPYRVADLNADSWHELNGGLCTWDYGTLHFVRLPGFVFADPTGDGCLIYEVEPAAGTMTPVAHLGEVGARVEEIYGRAGGRTFFEGITAATGRELWRTDGTPEGTILLLDATAGTASTYGFRAFAAGEPWSYFFRYLPETGYEPWRTDGTPEGTALLADLYPGEFGSGYWSRHGFLGPYYFFVANDGVAGPEVWRTDGTSDGTFALTALDTGPEASLEVDFARLPSAMIFTTRADDGPVELRRADGSPSGTQLLLSVPIAVSAHVRPLAVQGDRALLEIDSGGEVRLWVTDGTVGGTQVVTTLPGAAAPYVARPLPVGDGWLFFARDAAHGVEPWTTDGTAGGTHLVADVYPGPESSATSDRSYYTAALGDRVLLRLDDGVHGFEMWVTDGTATGTQLVRDLEPGRESSWYDLLGAQDGYELFRNESRLWRTDGTPAGTVPIAELGRLVAPSDPARLARVGDRVYFDARPGDWHLHPARSDGSETGTHWLAAGAGGWLDGPSHFAALGGDAFVANTDYDGWGDGYSLLWSGDLPDSPLAELVYSCGARCTTGLGHAPPAAGGFALYADWTEELGSELWRTDGSNEGTSPLIDLIPGPESGYPSQIVQAGDAVWFTARDAEGNEKVWRSRGTPETTAVVAVLPGTVLLPRSQIWPIDPRIGSFFVQQFEGGVARLRYSAGFGQALVTVASGVAISSSKTLGRVGGRVLFAGESDLEPPTGRELWVSDGTPEGTHLLRDIWPGEPDSSIGAGVEVGGRVFFPACDPVAGCELWASDGTEAGTGRFLDLEPGAGSSRPIGLSKIGSSLYFTACRVETGCEGWVTNGTVAGTSQIAEIAPGPLSSLPVEWWPWYFDYGAFETSQAPAFVEAGDRIFFAADDGTGTELWAIMHGVFRDGFESGDTSRWIGGP